MTGAQVPRLRCVGGLVRDASGRLLLIRRANDPGRGLWSLPGGKVEDGETDAEALAREVAEETGLLVAVGEFVGSVERAAPNGVYDIHDYACSVTGGDLRAADDALDVHWVDYAILTTLDRTNALVEGLFHTLDEWSALPR